MRIWWKGKRVPIFSRNTSLTSIIVLLVLCTSTISISAASDSAIINITPLNQTLYPGDTINISINCTSLQPIKAYQFDLSFNPRILQITSVSEGNFFEGNLTFFNPGNINNDTGTITNIYCLILGPGNVTNNGTFVSVNFTAKSTSGTTVFALKNLNITNEDAVGVPVEVTTTRVTVIGPSDSSSPNQPPFSPMKPEGPALITLGAPYVYNSSAVDPDGDYVRLRFDWGDGSVSNWTEFVSSNTQVSLSHAWMNISNNTLRVIAQDEHTRNSSWSDPLTVIGFSPPVASFIIPPNGSVNKTILFNASGSYASDGIIVSYQWDFGDGVNRTGKTAVHEYRRLGQYNVTLTITDDSGITDSTTQIINVSATTAEVSNENNALLSFSLSTLALIVIFGMFLSVLVIFRDRIGAFLIQRSIDSSRRKLARFDGKSMTVEEILDSIFLDMENKTTVPNAYNILDAYSVLINNYVEKKDGFRLPDQSSEKIERRVEDRIHAMIVEKIDMM
jgi:PKD repeat protein